MVITDSQYRFIENGILTMNTQLMTYSQLRAALLDRYQRPPTSVPESQVENHLAEIVFGPLEMLLQRVNRLEQITDRLVTDSALPAADRSQLVSEFQDTLEQILVDYQETLLQVPSETVEPASEAAAS